MAALSPSCVELFGQRHHGHGITKPLANSRLTTPDPISSLSHNPVKDSDFENTSSFTSNNTTPSRKSILVHCLPKDQVSHCLKKYQALAREGLHFNSAEAVFWCSLGLGVVVCSQISPAQPIPFSGQCSEYILPLNAISDSGFAPSFDTGRRNRLLVDDPNVESTITNLVGGLAGVFASGLLDITSISHGLPLPEVGQGPALMLSHFGFDRDQGTSDVLSLVAEISAQLLLILQNNTGIAQPSFSVSYWALCLKFVVGTSSLLAAEVNASTSNNLRSQLMQCNPPHCLAEPARSYIFTTPFQGRTLEPIPVSNPDPLPELPHIATRFHHRTQSRAAYLMSHTSLRSFSSIQFTGGLSAKSSTTTSLSHDIWAIGSVLGPPATALGALGLLAESLKVIPQEREHLSTENEHSIATPSSSFKKAHLCSMSDSLQKETGKGKAKAIQLPREGLRPGTANLRVRTGTRFVVTSPPVPSGLRSNPYPLLKMDPLLAALEKNSKLKSKSRCLNCGKRGENHPCCPKCGEGWCSRQCRVEANNVGKHICMKAALLV
ncbi:hypothetical protein V565_049430 [Rhizoctonia solani 123E]|uniref:Uncharacterized protein n=1 Tax=Rhizoctonia solani 123E TaxID=1423351 RepID=A0A074S3P6_9AGAM|nr:hypothetical protein V565_049430 [Rhizoctonia solani 123E]